MTITWYGRLIRKIVKRLLYSMLCFRDGFLVLLGRTKSYVRFTIEADPPSVFYNFRVNPDCIDELEEYLNLPPGFTLEKMRFLPGDEPDYYISLNVYRVTGITNAVRAEWSVFVWNSEEETDVVRYMVVEAQSSTLTIDPVHIFERPRKVEQSFRNNLLQTHVKSFEKAYFKASCTVPPEDKLTYAYASREWLKAIDLIYWPNGIGDRTYYDGAMACSDIMLIPPESVKIKDTTVWSRFIDPVPDSVIMFPDAIEYVMSPWWNL
jgi:hypothetical protein